MPAVRLGKAEDRQTRARRGFGGRNGRVADEGKRRLEGGDCLECSSQGAHLPPFIAKTAVLLLLLQCAVVACVRCITRGAAPQAPPACERSELSAADVNCADHC
ncbi:hypothetical protein HPB50_018665 [Hyalomma asiaticum]|uniref:Uncharacterized protein n=1 Tax=Hyalomma asiaticum TaxID=266040 RepID=A0ACB7SIY9_HYAAI|nr:hypothetical protein HPB50_018665 [Hyalomma asiaticum]